MANKQDMVFHIDETWDLEVEVEGPDGEAIVPVQAEWRVANSKRAYVLATLGDGITATGSSLRIIVPRAKQNGIPGGFYDHELWVVDGSTTYESVQLVGQINVKDSLKRRFPSLP